MNNFNYLDKNIKDLFMQTFPSATVLPKMNLLEQHVIPWLKKYRIGLGFNGDQGAESIHAAVNAITGASTSIPDKVSQVYSNIIAKCALF